MSNGKTGSRGLYVACMSICLGGGLFFFMLMMAAREAILAMEELAAHVKDIYLYCWGSLLPCLAAMVFFLLVVREIAEGRAFSERNSRLMRLIAGMAFLECAYLVAGCVGYSCIGLMHPGIMLIVLALVLVGGGIGLLAWALGRLVLKASGLQQECDLTV